MKKLLLILMLSGCYDDNDPNLPPVDTCYPGQVCYDSPMKDAGTE